VKRGTRRWGPAASCPLPRVSGVLQLLTEPIWDEGHEWVWLDGAGVLRINVNWGVEWELPEDDSGADAFKGNPRSAGVGIFGAP
jgi:hypothetical protein